MRRPSPVKPEEDLLRYAIDSAAMVSITDTRGTIFYVNAKCCEISGFSEPELINANHRIFSSGMHERKFFADMYRRVARGETWRGEICNRHKDGSIYWVDTTIVPYLSSAAKVEGYIAIRFDITGQKQLEDKLRAAHDDLRRIANVDHLTGLPNRRDFQNQLDILVRQGQRPGPSFHLAVLDLDMFKEINDTFGHAGGDALLRTVADRLKSISDERVLAFRLGGDEFGLTLLDVMPAQADAFFNKLLEAMRLPIPIAESARQCSASIGVASFPADGRDSESLFVAADLALYQAKELGRDRVKNFRAALLEAADSKAKLLFQIEAGLARQEFELHYQPIISLKTDRKPSIEALMRWRHPTRGLLGPDAFLDVFHDPHIRAAFGRYSLEHAFIDAARFVQQGLAFNRVAINVTGSDFRSDAFLDRFFELCERMEMMPARFCVEATEGMFLGLGQKRIEQGLRLLHSAGVEITLDDFGTSFASLTQLREFPIDHVKIDRRFTANVVNSTADQATVRAILTMAHGLGAIVTATGVESREQAFLLSEMGCDQLQGWHFAKATTPDQLAEVLAALPW